MAAIDEDSLRGHKARLFPVAHISSDREAELRACQALMTMLSAVREFGGFVVKAAGGPVGRLQCYTEVPFPIIGTTKHNTLRPDGLIQVKRGRKTWSALVEVKVGPNPLEQEQFDNYHKLAKEVGCDAFITVSSQAATAKGLPPLSIDGRRLRGVPVTHFSWDSLLSEAQVLSRKKAVKDPDQHWMLDEWVVYVASRASRIVDPPSFGNQWHEVLKAAQEGNLRGASPDLSDVIAHWSAFVRKTALRLRARLGAEVEPVLSRSDKSDPAHLAQRLRSHALATSELIGELKVQGAAGTISISTALQARVVRLTVELAAPTEGRISTRINWLVRQLKNMPSAPEGLLVIVDWSKRGLISQSRLDEIRRGGSASLTIDIHARLIPRDIAPRRYRLEWTTSLKSSRGRSSAATAEGIIHDLERFYQNVVEHLTAYVPPVPQLPPSKPGTDSPPAPKSTDAE